MSNENNRVGSSGMIKNAWTDTPADYVITAVTSLGCPCRMITWGTVGTIVGVDENGTSVTWTAAELINLPCLPVKLVSLSASSTALDVKVYR